MKKSWQHASLRLGRGGPLFGAMHEDAAIERGLLAPGGRAACVLSAGDIAFGLLRAGAGEVVAADPSPLQHELVSLKLEAVRSGLSLNEAAGKRLNEVMNPAQYLRQKAPWHTRPLLAAGMVDARLRWLARWVNPWVIGSPRQHADWKNVFRRKRWRWAWNALGLAVRVLFPFWYRRHLPSDFIQRLRQRFENCCLRPDAPANPLLVRLLSADVAGAAWAWESTWPQQETGQMQRLKTHAGLLSEVADGGPFDLVSVSNILDTQPRTALKGLLNDWRKGVKPGGWIVLRSLVWETSEWPAPPAGWIMDAQQTLLAKQQDQAPLCQVSAIYRRVSGD